MAYLDRIYNIWDITLVAQVSSHYVCHVVMLQTKIAKWVFRVCTPKGRAPLGCLYLLYTAFVFVLQCHKQY
jgi:hypothetical protein